MTVVSPCGTVIVSSLGYFSYVGSSFKISHPSLSLSLGVHHIQEYFKKKRGGGAKNYQATGGEGQAHLS